MQQLRLAPADDIQAARKLVVAENYVFDVYTKTQKVDGVNVQTSGVAVFEFDPMQTATMIKSVGWYYDETMTDENHRQTPSDDWGAGAVADDLVYSDDDFEDGGVPAGGVFEAAEVSDDDAF